MDASHESSRAKGVTGASGPVAASRLANIFLVLCVLAACVLVSMTLFGDYRYTFHSDGALKTVLAREAWAEGHIGPRDWVYANGDLFFVGPQIFAELLYPLTGMTYLNNALADWLAYVALLIASVAVGKVVIGHWRAAGLCGTLVASGLCAASFEFTIGQGAYSLWSALSLLLSSAVAVATRGRPSVIRWRWAPFLAAGVLSLLGAMCNPTRGVVSIAAPIAIGWCAYVLLHGEGSVRNRLRGALHPMVLALLGGAVAGLLVNRYAIMPHIHNFDAAARIGLSTPAGMWKHVKMLPYAWFDYLRVGAAWPNLTPWRRLLQGCLWILAIAMALSPIAIVLRARRYGRAIVAFAWVTMAMYGVAIAALVVAPSLFLGTGELRYLTFAMANSLVTVVSVLLPSAIPSVGRRTVCIVAALFAVALSAQWSLSLRCWSAKTSGPLPRRTGIRTS
jgi:ABC-type multidrug transport system fused ATPase/permease subunit